MADADDEPPKRLTPAERAELKREEKLADIREQIDSGNLTVRKVSAEEKAEWEKRQAERPPRPSRKKR